MRSIDRMKAGVVVSTVCAGLAGCPAKPTPTLAVRAMQAGSLAIDPKTNMLFVADSFNGGVAIVDPTATSGHVAFIATGTRPEHVLLRSGNAFASNRFS